MNTEILETGTHLLGEGATFKGEFQIDAVARLRGKMQGFLRGLPGSTLILEENSVFEGQIEGDTILISGFVEGDIQAKSSVLISRTGRVKGKIQCPSLKIESGAYFEGSSEMGT